MSEQATDLATLRIDREARPRPSRRWVVILVGLLGVVLCTAALSMFCGATPVEVEVATVRAAGGASAAVLNASGLP